MKNLIDNDALDVMYDLKLYKTISIAALIVIFVLSTIVVELLDYQNIQQGRINNLEQANNSLRNLK